MPRIADSHVGFLRGRVALAERIAAALSSAALAEQGTAPSSPVMLPARPRIAVVGPAPPGLRERSIAAPDIVAAARAIEAGAAEVLWVSIEGEGPGEKNMSQATLGAVAAALAADPVLRDIPVALARTDAGDTATVALACLLSGAWGRLAPAFPPSAGDPK